MSNDLIGNRDGAINENGMDLYYIYYNRVKQWKHGEKNDRNGSEYVIHVKYERMFLQAQNNLCKLRMCDTDALVLYLDSKYTFFKFFFLAICVLIRGIPINCPTRNITEFCEINTWNQYVSIELIINKTTWTILRVA